jgi:hypothetical protein
MDNCPICHGELSSSNVSMVCSGFYYACSSSDHQYRKMFDVDFGEWIELDINDKTYYGNDVLRIANLKAFI